MDDLPFISMFLKSQINNMIEGNNNSLITDVFKNNDDKKLVIDLFRETINNADEFEKLIESKDTQLSAIAEKSIKETNYHLRHSSKWVIRLGDGTPESHSKVQSSINNLWMFTDELFEMNKNDILMEQQKIGVDCKGLKSEWDKMLNNVFMEATVNRPEDCHMTSGGRSGIHTEYLGHLLTDMQYLQRSYPDAKW